MIFDGPPAQEKFKTTNKLRKLFLLNTKYVSILIKRTKNKSSDVRLVNFDYRKERLLVALKIISSHNYDLQQFLRMLLLAATVAGCVSGY